jgi:hypothetical protein
MVAGVHDLALAVAQCSEDSEVHGCSTTHAFLAWLALVVLALVLVITMWLYNRDRGPLVWWRRLQRWRAEAKAERERWTPPGA